LREQEKGYIVQWGREEEREREREKKERKKEARFKVRQPLLAFCEAFPAKPV